MSKLAILKITRGGGFVWWTDCDLNYIAMLFFFIHLTSYNNIIIALNVDKTVKIWSE